MRAHQRTDLLLEDYCDGSDFRNHELFSAYHQSLQVNLYYDDAEVCNPLGSKAKVHKIGLLIYFDDHDVTMVCKVFSIIYLETCLRSSDHL